MTTVSAKPDYYAVFVHAFNNSSGRKEWEPLDYGEGDEPEPSLLLRRKRIALFASESEAEAALKDTCKRSLELGHEWPKTHTLTIKPAMCRAATIAN